MRSGFPFVVGLLWFSLVTAEAAETYKIDPVHSNAGFKIKHLFAKLPGRFTEINGTIVGDVANPEETRVQVQINTASISTNDPKRDEHLRSPEFFDAAQFPNITFVSKKVHRTGEDTAFVTGDLTMRGVTKEAILDVKFLGRGKDAQGALRTGWDARTALKRSDFGLTWSKAVEGTQVVGNDVEIELNIEAVEEAAPADLKTTQTDPTMKEPSALSSNSGTAAKPVDPLGALPPGGQSVTPAPTQPTPAPEVPKKTDAQSGNLPGAVPGEGALPTVPNPAKPPTPATPAPVTPPPAPADPQNQSPAPGGIPAPKPTPQKPAGETQA